MPLVCLDPGHGGEDPGAIGPTGLHEAEVNWAVSTRVKQYLERLGYDVVLTRSQNDRPTQIQRARMADYADVLVSIHANSFNDPKVRGMEALIYTEKYDSGALAHILLYHLGVTTARQNRGIKLRPDLTVLKEAVPPAVLVELAFISNPDEEILLKADWYREKAALGIAYAIRDFPNQTRR